MAQLFAVLQSRGPAWNHALPMDDQAEWTAHARFMDRLLDDGFVVLGGPLEGSQDVLLIIRAKDEDEIAERLSSDPWRRNGLLVARQTWPWRLRLGMLA